MNKKRFQGFRVQGSGKAESKPSLNPEL